MTLRHHELCFGCGQANIFGLQIELERQPDGSVKGRFFLKQDHQGPPGFAHGGVLAAALDEAAALAAGDGERAPVTAHLELEFRAPAPIGTFVHLHARVEREEKDGLWVVASALGEGDQPPELARVRARFSRRVG